MNSEIYFDPDEQNYKYKKTNRKVSDYQLRKLAIKQIIAIKNKNQNITNQLLAGNITLRSWEYQTAKNIKDAHVAMFRLGIGGKKQAVMSDYLKVANELRLNHYPNFRRFVKQIKNGELSRKQINARLNMYWKSAKVSFENAFKDRKIKKGDRFAARRLGSCSPHCQSCIRYYQVGITSIADLILPGVACECRSNCCCDYVTGRTRKEVAAKLK